MANVQLSYVIEGTYISYFQKEFQGRVVDKKIAVTIPHASRELAPQELSDDPYLGGS